MAHNEAPSNWLSKIIKEKRETIKKPLPFREQRAEQKAIVDAIKADPKGKELANKSELDNVVFAALGVANHLERDPQRGPDGKPLMTASPAIQASWFIFDELGLPRPDSEF